MTRQEISAAGMTSGVKKILESVLPAVDKKGKPEGAKRRASVERDKGGEIDAKKTRQRLITEF